MVSGISSVYRLLDSLVKCRWIFSKVKVQTAASTRDNTYFRLMLPKIILYFPFC